MNPTIDIGNVILESPRLTLRAFKESDLLDFYNYAKIDGVGECAGWAHHKNIEETKKILDIFIAGKKTFALVRSGKVIGSLGIERYSESFSPELKNLKGREIGYVLSKDYWGQGLMSEAVKRVLKYCFEELHLDFLVCGHFIENVRSARVMEKCGFTFFRRGNYLTSMGETKENILTIAFPYSTGVIEMNLNEEPFAAIKSGRKTIEMRLNDEKRQSLRIGDEIRFLNFVTRKELLTRIISLEKFPSFKELYEHFPLEKLGYYRGQEGDYRDMEIYYSEDNIKKYGTLAIGIALEAGKPNDLN